VRLKVKNYIPSKQQKRCWNKNKDIITLSHPAQYNEEHFQLYSRYLASRHPEGGMDPLSKNGYHDIINSEWSDSELIEFRRGQVLVAVAVIDKLKDGLSAVYTFFEPELSKLSLGILCIQHEIELVKQRSLKWLYLGYWNPESQKMSYKTRFQPLEYFFQNDWQVNEPFNKISLIK
jgi:arginine-tRNA-protein transferase